MISKKDLDDLYQIFTIIEQNAAAGISIMEALKLYSKSCRPKIQKILEAIQHDVSNGVRLTDAFAKHPDIFPDYIVEMMRVNEGTGQSEKIFHEIVRTLEQQVDVRRNLGSQIWQGGFMLILLLITVGVVFFVVLPSTSEMMKSLNLRVPIYTQVLLDIGTMTQTYWYAFLICGIVLITSLVVFFKRNPATFARVQLRIPLYRLLKFYMLQYRFAMIFGLCKEAGLDTIRALKYTASGSDNILMQQLIERTIREMSKTGNSMTKAIKKHDSDNIIDESFYMFFQAGEKSNIAELMKKRSEFYQKQLIAESKMFNTKLSNAITTPFFIILGAIVLAVVSPMFSMMDQISKGGIG